MRSLTRAALAFFVLTAVGCQATPTSAEGAPRERTFVNTDGDGLPDAAMAAPPFFDRNGDGLPDTRACRLSHRESRRIIVIDADDDGLPDTRAR